MVRRDLAGRGTAAGTALGAAASSDVWPRAASAAAGAYAVLCDSVSLLDGSAGWLCGPACLPLAAGAAAPDAGAGKLVSTPPDAVLRCDRSIAHELRPADIHTSQSSRDVHIFDDEWKLSRICPTLRPYLVLPSAFCTSCS